MNQMLVKWNADRPSGSNNRDGNACSVWNFHYIAVYSRLKYYITYVNSCNAVDDTFVDMNTKLKACSGYMDEPS